MGLQVRHQDGANRTFSLRVTVCRSIDRQSRDVRAHGAGRLGLEDNRVVDRHSTPASRRMRLPNRPASFFVWTATHTSLPVVGCFSNTWLRFPERISTNPAAFSLRMTSAQVTWSS